MVSFYMVSPSGFAIEYGYDGWQVDWDDFTSTISHAKSFNPRSNLKDFFS